jgi:hypothetical protein
VADLSREELQRLARLGARARLEELKSEEAAIRQAFPDLFRPGRRPRARIPESNTAASSTPAARRRGRRSRMSASARKAVSERMKKYWAERRRKNA